MVFVCPCFYCLLLWSQSAETQFPKDSVFYPYSAVCLKTATFVGGHKNCRNSFVRTEEVDSANSAAVSLFSHSILWKVIRERTQRWGTNRTHDTWGHMTHEDTWHMRTQRWGRKYWTHVSGSQEHTTDMSSAPKYFLRPFSSWLNTNSHNNLVKH